jgi:hypothetical protein
VYQPSLPIKLELFKLVGLERQKSKLFGDFFVLLESNEGVAESINCKFVDLIDSLKEEEEEAVVAALAGANKKKLWREKNPQLMRYPMKRQPTYTMVIFFFKTIDINTVHLCIQ